jgi:hypothetical protein
LWPDTWPKELERYRDQAKTHGVAHGISENVHEISFTKRDEFEKAWPIRARMKKQELPREIQPFESEMEEIGGRLVGVFAKDAVGNLTHPATSTHTHLLFKDPTSGKTVTGHVEQIGLRKGAVLRLPQ